MIYMTLNTICQKGRFFPPLHELLNFIINFLKAPTCFFWLSLVLKIAYKSFLKDSIFPLMRNSRGNIQGKFRVYDSDLKVFG